MSGQHSPLTAGFDNIKYRIIDVKKTMFTLALAVGLNNIFNEQPLIDEKINSKQFLSLFSLKQSEIQQKVAQHKKVATRVFFND